ncbi:MAG: hypothetical protein ACI8ZN_000990, partial [Bacteroidia bacterium]
LIETGEFVEYNFSTIKNEASELINILTAIVKTTQQDLRKS